MKTIFICFGKCYFHKKRLLSPGYPAPSGKGVGRKISRGGTNGKTEKYHY